MKLLEDKGLISLNGASLHAQVVTVAFVTSSIHNYSTLPLNEPEVLKFLIPPDDPLQSG